MLKVVYDNQIFARQKVGGISRYAAELIKINNSDIETELIDTVKKNISIQPKYDLLSRGTRYIKRKTLLNKQLKKTEYNYTNQFVNKAFDVFHPTYYDPYFLEFTKKPFVLTVHDMIHEIFFEFFDPNDPASGYKRSLCNKAEKIITVSETTKNDLINIFKISPNKIHAIPLASDFGKIKPVQPASTEGLENYILFVGDREDYKNFYFTAIALSELLLNDKSLLLVCTKQVFTNAEINFFKTLKIEHQVKHINAESDGQLSWAYRNARLFIFPSLYEGFGFPMLEAFSCNCPVIASNGGSLPEVGGEAALYFNPKNILEIRDAAYDVLYDDKVRNNLISKGNEQLSKYSWDTVRAKTVEVYKEVLHKNIQKPTPQIS